MMSTVRVSETEQVTGVPWWRFKYLLNQVTDERVLTVVKSRFTLAKIIYKVRERLRPTLSVSYWADWSKCKSSEL